MANWIVFFIILAVCIQVYVDDDDKDRPDLSLQKTKETVMFEPVKKVHRNCSDKVHAYTMTRELVKSQLKSPQSAKFGSIFNKQQVQITADSPCVEHPRVAPHRNGQ